MKWKGVGGTHSSSRATWKRWETDINPASDGSPRGPPHSKPPHTALHLRCGDHTHTDTCSLWNEHTCAHTPHTLGSKPYIQTGRHTHSSFSCLFKEETAMDLDWFPVLYYSRWKLQVQLHPLTIKCSCFSWNNWASSVYILCIGFIFLGSAELLLAPCWATRASPFGPVPPREM